MRSLKNLLLLSSVCTLTTQLALACAAGGAATGQVDNSIEAGPSEGPESDATASKPTTTDGGSRDANGDASVAPEDAGGATDAGPDGSATVLELASGIGGTASREQNLTVKAGESFRLGGGECTPTSTIFPDYPMDLVEVANNTGKDAVVTLFQTVGPSGKALDTLIWTYTGSVAPADNAAKRACAGSVLDFCDPKLCGSPSFGAIKSLSMKAGARLLVYSGGYSASESGDLTLNVKTEALK